ncbi:MAG TPA: response regulator transcription factor [Gemmatimonadaceae bacterium]
MSYTDMAEVPGAAGTRQREGGVASMGSTSFSVMCIDDNVLLVDALERRLNLEAGFDAMYRVDDAATAVQDAVRLKPSVILLDMDLPGGIDAMVLLDEIVASVPDSRVLIFTGYPSGDLVRRTMSRGAWGFVSKGTTSDRLIAAIRQVVAGQAVIELED